MQLSLQKERLTAQIAQEQLIRVHSEMDIRTQTLEQNTQAELAVEQKKAQVIFQPIMICNVFVIYLYRKHEKKFKNDSLSLQTPT